MTPGKKKLLIAMGAFSVTLIAALVIVPVLFKDRIAARARAELNRTVNARVDWGGIGLTFFRNFPNLTLGLNNLNVVGIERFEGDTLASVGSFRVVLDAGSVVSSLLRRGPIVVRSVHLAEPDLRLKVLADGAANWDIMKRRADRPEQAEGTGRAMVVELRSVELSGGSIVFDNARSGLYASLEGLRHSLSGNFSRDSLGVRTRTHADQTTVRFAGTPWLAGVALDFDADVDADLADKRFAFSDNELRLNDLALRFSGQAARVEDGFTLDVTFNAPSTEFGQILSLVPAIYAQDFASLETSGTFSLEGHARGTYAENRVPAFALHATVNDGMFRYPDLPLPAQGIALDLAIDNPGGQVDSTVLNLRRFHAEIGGQPLNAAFTLRTPVSDPDVDARVQGTLDLADLARTVKLENVKQLAGVVAANVSVRAKRSDVDSARYERIAAQGIVSARDVTLESAELRQPVAVEDARLTLSPQRADLESFRARLGSSDLEATGWIENLLGFMMRDEPLRGSATFNSRHFVLDEWRSDDPDREVIPVPAMLDLSLNGSIERLTFSKLEMSNAHGGLRVKDERLTLDDFTFETLGGRIGMSGYYETADTTRPTFAIDLAIDSLGIREASEALLTVRTLAPVARYARGTFSADLDLNGALARDLTPLLDVLDGGGSLLTSRIAIEGFPLMQRLAERLNIPRLSNPTLNAIRSSIAIREGRLHVRPFHVGVGDFNMQVSGSNGIDQSLDYSLNLALPRAVLGDAADRLVQDLSARAGQLGLDLRGADSIRVGVRVTGTITDPSLNVALGEIAASVSEQVEQAAGAAVDRQVDEARERLDSARAEARRRAQARVDSLVADAEQRADTIRAATRRLADSVRAAGNRRADDLLARATNEIARRAAQPLADRIRKEADEQANELVRQADQRADALVAEARRRADELVRQDTAVASGRTPQARDRPLTIVDSS